MAEKAQNGSKSSFVGSDSSKLFKLKFGMGASKKRGWNPWQQLGAMGFTYFSLVIQHILN